MERRKNPDYDLKLKYRRTVEVSLIISLLLIASLFIASKKIDFTKAEIALPGITNVDVIDIPITEQRERLPEPARPSIPIAIDDPDFPDEITLPVDKNWDIPAELPPAMDDARVPFYKVEIPPKFIGGEKALYNYIIDNDLYPEMALLGRLEGKALIGFTVNTNGIPVEVKIIQEKPAGYGFGDAGVIAIKNMRFTPGQQRDKLVSVEMQQEIIYKLK